MNTYPKLYLGPMRKNIVDSAIESDLDLGLIPSRRQVDHDTGYVNNWRTANFVDYVKSRSNKILIQRDHAGPMQGTKEDNGFNSLFADCKSKVDIIHIDPWKQEWSAGKKGDMNFAIVNTTIMIDHCCRKSDDVLFEVGTEEAIYRYEATQLARFLKTIKKSVGEEKFKRVKFAVIQSGVGLLGTENTGTFDEQRCKDMISVCKDFGLLSKEHNGDYLNKDIIARRFEIGLDGINIAPELGVEETRCVLERIEKEDRKDLFDRLFKACFLSKFWVKWLPDGFDPADDENKKRLLVEVCGHYIFNTEEFKDITSELVGLNESIKSRLLNKIKQLHESCSMPNRNDRG